MRFPRPERAAAQVAAKPAERKQRGQTEQEPLQKPHVSRLEQSPQADESDGERKPHRSELPALTGQLADDERACERAQTAEPECKALQEEIARGVGIILGQAGQNEPQGEEAQEGRAEAVHHHAYSNGPDCPGVRHGLTRAAGPPAAPRDLRGRGRYLIGRSVGAFDASVTALGGIGLHRLARHYLGTGFR